MTTCSHPASVGGDDGGGCQSIMTLSRTYSLATEKPSYLSVARHDTWWNIMTQCRPSITHPHTPPRYRCIEGIGAGLLVACKIGYKLINVLRQDTTRVFLFLGEGVFFVLFMYSCIFFVFKKKQTSWHVFNIIYLFCILLDHRLHARLCTDCS